MSKCREWNLAGLIAILLFMQVDTLSLTNTQLPDEGFVQFKYRGSNNKVCWSSLKQRAKFVICRQLGFQKDKSIVKKSTPSGNKVGIFTGNIRCAGQETSLSQCSIKTTGRKATSCKFLSYLKCAICPRPQLVEHKNRFPDSSFTAPNSITSSPSNARRNSGSSWCAPVADGKHYLQLDLGRVYVIYRVATFGDTNSAKWVTTYQLNYTVDMINWENAMGKNITGNKQAYSDASITVLGAKIVRAFRFIPLAYVGQPCMRIEACGGTRYPDKPTGLTVTKIKSGSAEISWVNPNDTGDYNAGLAPLTGFLIKLKKGNCLVVNITTKKVNKWQLTNLDSNTTYEVSVAAGNIRGGFGQATTTSFQTAKIITSSTTVVRGVSLSNSTLPNEGFVQIKYGGTKNVCWQSLKNKADNVLCRQLGYTKEVSLVEKPIPANNDDSVFSGSINCNGKEKNLSQCTVTNSEKTCSQLSYIKCFVCTSPLLENKQKFPDSSFTASASSEGHSPSDARISSGSSWCAPVANGKHYLQVDLKKLYVMYNFVTFAGSTCFKWVTSYNLNYTVDGINWKRIGRKRISGNKNAYDASNTHINKGLTTRALRFIPITYVGQPCMRIQICGATRFPDKPTNFTVTNIKSRNVEISWREPKNVGDKKILTRFLIQLIKDNSVIRNITTAKVNKRKLGNLTPNTTYEISVAAGNRNGFGEKTTTSFTTLAKASLPNNPSMLRVTNITSKSAGISWKDPVNGAKAGLTRYWIKLTKKNNLILNITINKVNKYEIDDLFANTIYQISVAAGNQDGFGKATIRSFTTRAKASLPVKPTNLTVTNIKSRNVEISWTDPKNVGDKKILTRFLIQLIKDNSVIRNITTAKVNKRKLRNLTPNTTYQISVAAGNRNGFGEKTTTSFTTLAKVQLPNKPLKLRVTNITSESAGISWKDPMNGAKAGLTRYWIKLAKKNNLILNITTNKVNKYEIDDLFANTTYQISVAAGNQDGFGKETTRSFTTRAKASLPDKPTNLTVTNIKSRNVEISWTDPKNVGDKKILTRFLIQLIKNNSVIRNITTARVNKRKLRNLTPNTTYQISVAAGNRNGFSEKTTTSFTTLAKVPLPNKPSKLRVTNITSKSAGISWKDPVNGGKAGLTRYWIKLRTKNNLILNITINKVNKYEIDDLFANTTYQIFVAAGNEDGFGKETTRSFTTRAKASLPDKPTNLTVSNIKSRNVEISWTEPKNVGDKKILTRFLIQLIKDNSVIRNITTAKVNKRKLRNLTPNTTYQISVAAGNRNGFGEKTITSLTTLAKVPLPNKPLKLRVTNITSESAGISWKDPMNGAKAGLTRYWIKLTKKNNLILNITINKVNKYEIDNLVANTTYQISVAAGNQDGFGKETTRSFTTRAKASLPDKPTNLTVTNIKSRNVEISWTDPKNVGDKKILTRYLIQLIKDNSVIRNITTARVNKRKLRNLTPNTTYQISVAAGNRNGFSEKTTTSFTTLAKVPLPNKPSKLRVTNITSKSAGISWKDPVNGGKAGLTRYWIKLRTKNNLILNITINKVNKYEIDDLFANTTYQIFVAAGNEDGFGKETTRSFTTRAKAFLPDKPTNLTVSNIKSRNVEISWREPKNVGDKKILTRFLIQLIKDNSVIRNITTARVNKRKLRNLTPNTTYQISVAAGNRNGFGEKTITSFTTLAKVSLPNKPLKLRVTNITSKSAGISWKDPVNGGKAGLTRYWIKLTKKNNLILNITINKINKYEIDDLFASTTYQISVAAGNQDGFGKATIRSFTTLPKASLPDKPSKLTVSSVTSESAKISWENPANGRKNGLTGFWIKLTKDGTLILNITIKKVNKYEIDDLFASTTYQISVAAGNQNGFGEETIISFTTPAEASLPNKPSKLTVTSITSDSAGISWVDPVNDGKSGLIGFWIKLMKNNTLILNITIKKVNKYTIYNLTSNTTYEIFLAAGNPNGFGEEAITSFRTTAIPAILAKLSDTGEKQETDNSSDGYVAGVTMLTVVLLVVLTILGYIIYRYRQFKSAIAEHFGEETSAKMTAILTGKQRLESVISENLGEQTSAEITALLSTKQRIESTTAENLENTSAHVTVVLPEKDRKVSKDLNANPVQMYVPMVVFTSKGEEECFLPKGFGHYEKKDSSDIGYV